LLARAFLPFQESTLAPRTEITLLEPRDGNVNISINQPVQFRVSVQGRVPAVNQPDSLKLWYRYTKNDIYKTKPMQPTDDGEWTATLLGDQIPSSGLLYKVTGGDAETPEYTVRVQSAPLVTKYVITYEPRPYRPWAKRTVTNLSAADIEEYEGTEVRLRITANRELHSAQVVVVLE